MRRLFSLWQTSRQDLRVIFSAVRMPGRPRWLLPAMAVLAFFALEPANFALPLLGVVDDLLLLPLLLRGLAALLGATADRARDARVVSVQ